MHVIRAEVRQVTTKQKVKELRIERSGRMRRRRHERGSEKSSARETTTTKRRRDEAASQRVRMRRQKVQGEEKNSSAPRKWSFSLSSLPARDPARFLLLLFPSLSSSCFLMSLFLLPSPSCVSFCRETRVKNIQNVHGKIIIMTSMAADGRQKEAQNDCNMSREGACSNYSNMNKC